MREKTHNLLIRTATGIVFVAVVLGAMMLGRVTYTLLLAGIVLWCVEEFWHLGRGRAQKLAGSLYIMLAMTAMWFFPYVGAGMTGLPAWGGFLPCASGGCALGACGEWDARIAPAFIITVWANDVFAYLIGITFGRHKMAGQLSPNKSWEGFAGGVVGAITVAALVGKLWLQGDTVMWMAFGLVVAISAVGGDLVESGFKRRAGVKDSGKLLPGHGGMLDRLDATLGAAPVAFLFFVIVTFLAR